MTAVVGFATSPFPCSEIPYPSSLSPTRRTLYRATSTAVHAPEPQGTLFSIRRHLCYLFSFNAAWSHATVAHMQEKDGANAPEFCVWTHNRVGDFNCCGLAPLQTKFLPPLLCATLSCHAPAHHDTIINPSDLVPGGFYWCTVRFPAVSNVPPAVMIDPLLPNLSRPCLLTRLLLQSWSPSMPSPLDERLPGQPARPLAPMPTEVFAASVCYCNSTHPIHLFVVFQPNTITPETPGAAAMAFPLASVYLPDSAHDDLLCLHNNYAGGGGGGPGGDGSRGDGAGDGGGGSQGGVLYQQLPPGTTGFEGINMSLEAAWVPPAPSTRLARAFAASMAGGNAGGGSWRLLKVSCIRLLWRRLWAG
ncbi:hypothetical protein BDK51DRAFT_41642 [Blyttiomyces helicus]|uniref:Uncharacterized protein n=1 Tax=Blyttiomyces helicus TaxID=388810 RepID=A0A4V1IRL7_9FUNG|nr:hypothetical protein BDK51DRAFT_41642 [Blyttiomyces helicus]|eukprot:RKO90497.1 hypothetical protein BDK51DRAFT_41642 [Blyttiomyces helicus]